MRTPVVAFGILALALVQCGGDKGLFVADDRGGGAGDDSGGTGAGMAGGSAGSSSGSAGTGAGTDGLGGDGVGATAGTGGTAGTDQGGTAGSDQGGTATAGTAGDAGSGIGGSGFAGFGAVAGMPGGGHGGMNAGGRAGAGNAGRAGAPSDDDCDELARQYTEALASAQTCSPSSVTNQCTVERPNALFCSCPTFVNSARTEPIQRLDALREQGEGCVRLCPAIACALVTHGVCSAGSGMQGGTRCVAMP